MKVKNTNKQNREKEKLLNKQQRLMERLIIENNKKIMAERGYYGVYDKFGNVLLK